MLVFDLSGSSDASIDYALIGKEASKINPQTLEMWNLVLAKAKDEASKRKQ